LTVLLKDGRKFLGLGGEVPNDPAEFAGPDTGYKNPSLNALHSVSVHQLVDFSLDHSL
jgi:hypothetical protein